MGRSVLLLYENASFKNTIMLQHKGDVKGAEGQSLMSPSGFACRTVKPGYCMNYATLHLRSQKGTDRDGAPSLLSSDKSQSVCSTIELYTMAQSAQR